MINFSCMDLVGSRRLALPKMPRGGEGFTLVELLVVVAIISLLMALLLPSLNRARQAAIGVVCMQNQRSIFLAETSFVSDHNGGMGGAGFGMATDGDKPNPVNCGWGWFGYLTGILPDQSSGVKYINNASALMCPGQWPNKWSQAVNYLNPFYGFNINASLSRNKSFIAGTPQTQFAPIGQSIIQQVPDSTGAQLKIVYLFKFSLVHMPATGVMLADSVEMNNPSRRAQTDRVGVSQWYGGSPSQGNWWAGCIHLRHVGTANMLFWDGHVASATSGALEQTYGIYYYTDENYQPSME